MFIIFASNVQVLCHIKIFLKLINVLKMKNVFILTELLTKHMFAYTLPREQDKNEVFSGFFLSVPGIWHNILSSHFYCSHLN